MRGVPGLGPSRSFVVLARGFSIVAAAKPRAARPARAEAAPPTASGVPCAARYTGQVGQLGPGYRASNKPTWAASGPTLLRCAARRWLPHALAGLAAPAFAGEVLAFPTKSTALGLRGRRCPAGAIWVATSSTGPGSARAQRALPPLTRRGCLNGAHAVSAVSSAARPRTEQRSAVGAQRRPPPHEPAPGSACRDALNRRTSRHPRTAASGRKQAHRPTAALRRTSAACTAMDH
jgi:hypothetical protein